MVYGHIHEAHGCSFDGETLFVNAASFPPGGRVEPIVVYIPQDRSKRTAVVSPSGWSPPQRGNGNAVDVEQHKRSSIVHDWPAAAAVIDVEDASMALLLD